MMRLRHPRAARRSLQLHRPAPRVGGRLRDPRQNHPPPAASGAGRHRKARLWRLSETSLSRNSSCPSL